MSLEAALRAFLLADPGVAAITSGVFPQPAPQDSQAPFVTWLLVAADENNTLDGAPGLRAARYQLDCWSDPPELGGTFKQSMDLADAVRQALKGFTGLQGDTKVSAVLLVDARDLRDDATKSHARSMDFRIWHQED